MDPKDIVRDGYDKVSYAYRGDNVDSADPTYSAWVNELLELLTPGAPVLELGCGNGIPVAKLLSQAGCPVTGVDLSPVQIERARRLVPEAQFVCGDMMVSTFPEASFAAVVSFYAIIHVPTAEQPGLLIKIHNWLRPAGYLMATVGAQAWTGTEEDWLGVDGARMYWSHTDTPTYRHWLFMCGYKVLWTRFIPEGDAGHTLLLAQRED